MDEIQQNIALMTVNGDRLELPRDVHFENYPEIKRVMLKAGGTYKNNGFVFPTDPRVILARLLSGEDVNDKKAFQFFQTPVWLANEMVRLAEVKEGDRVLEPSAGLGRLIAPARFKGAHVTAIEMDPKNLRELSERFHDVRIIAHDFLLMPYIEFAFDVVLMNPPFSKGQDIEHVLHAYKFLAPGGRLLAIMSEGVFFREDRDSQVFRRVMELVRGTSEKLPEKTFKESGTGVRARLVSIRRATSPEDIIPADPISLAQAQAA